MAIRYAPEERAALDARARAMLAECPDVGSFIRRGLGRNSSGEAIVYLRTALDPAPAVTSADAFRGLLGSASRWLRRNGVGPRDVVSLLAPNCTATSVAYWAAMSSAAVQPLNLLFTREAIAAQVAAVGAKILFAPPPGAPGGLFEKVEGLRALAPRLERIVVLPLDGTVAFDGEEIVPDGDANARRESAEAAEPDRVVALLPTGGTTGAPKVVPLTNRNVVSSAIASMLAGEFRAVDRIMVALPLFHVGGSFCAESRGSGRGRDFGYSDCRGISQSRGRRQLLAYSRGAAPDRRRAGPYRARRGSRRSDRRRRHLAIAAVPDRRVGLSARDRAAVPEHLAGRLCAADLRYDRVRRRDNADAMGPRTAARLGRRSRCARGSRRARQRPDPSRRLAERRNRRAWTADVLRLFRPEADRRDFP